MATLATSTTITNVKQELAGSSSTMKMKKRDTYGYSICFNPSSLYSVDTYSTSTTRDNAESSNTTSSDEQQQETADDESERSAPLAGAAIQYYYSSGCSTTTSASTQAHRRNSSIGSIGSRNMSVNSSLMDYSSDGGGGGSSVSMASSSASSRRSGRSTKVHYYNPQTIHTGTFLLNVLDSNTSSSSDLESLASEDESDHDHYFKDQLVFPLPRRERGGTFPPETHKSKKFYIFTDDDETSTISGGGDLAAAVAGTGADDTSSSIGSRSTLDDNTNDNVSNVSPTTWENYNKERGRIVAHQLLQPFQKNNGGAAGGGDTEESHSDCDDDDEGDEDTSPHKRFSSSSSPKNRLSLLGRRGRGLFFSPTKKRFTESTSPLDGGVTGSDDSNNNNSNNSSKHRVSDLACQAIADATATTASAKNNKLSSAVLTRNALVDFGAWEAVLRSKAAVNKNKHYRNSSHPGIRVDDDDEDVCTAILGLEETSHSSDDDDDDDVSVLFIKTASLMVQDFIFGSSSTKRSSKTKTTIKQRQHVVQAQMSIRDGLDECRRSTSEDVAAALGIADEGRLLLAHIRGRAGIIDDLCDDDDHDDETNTSTPESSVANNNNNIPWIHLYDAVWMPHYEEYVVRAVHAFSRRLMDLAPPTLAPPTLE